MKKFILLAALLVGLLVIAACGRNGDDTQPAADPTPAATPATDATAAPDPDPSPDGGIPWTGETITFRGFGADLGINEDPASPVLSLINEMIGNVEIIWELVPMGDRVTRMNLYLNAGDMPDFMWTNGRADIWNPGLADSGMFLDFNQFRQYMPNFNLMAETHPSATIFTNNSGELIVLPGMDNDQFPHGFFANMDVLEPLGIDIPITFDDMVEAMQIIRDSDPDIIPFHTRFSFAGYQGIFARIMDVPMPVGGIFWNWDNNEWDHHLINDGDFYRLISTMADFYARGFLHPEFMTMANDQADVIMASGNWGFTYHYAVIPNQWLGVGPMDDNPINFQAFLPPQPSLGVPAQVGIGHVTCNPIWGFAARRDVHNPEILAAVLDVVWNYEVSVKYQWGVEGVSFYYDTNGERQWLPEFLAAGADARREMGIWNTMLPRFVTLRQDLSDHRAQAPFAQEVYRIQAEAVIRGDLLALYPPLNPLFTIDQMEDNALINSAINTVRDEWIMQMVAGIRPMSDWDAMLAEVRAVANIYGLLETWRTAPPDPFIRPTAALRDYLIP
ncbi:MAG: extracellular solute-binding protein [Defluviitaleaceae bacterium]|nr:extracellular solute-binding protein [Defluviitaleaceae bacterium]